jgi:hypothetical protein
VREPHAGGDEQHAFRELGHEVVCIHEMVRSPIDWRGFDFLLFHKWDNYPEIHRLSRATTARVLVLRPGGSPRPDAA